MQHTCQAPARQPKPPKPQPKRPRINSLDVDGEVFASIIEEARESRDGHDDSDDERDDERDDVDSADVAGGSSVKGGAPMGKTARDKASVRAAQAAERAKYPPIAPSDEYLVELRSRGEALNDKLMVKHGSLKDGTPIASSTYSNDLKLGSSVSSRNGKEVKGQRPSLPLDVIDKGHCELLKGVLVITEEDPADNLSMPDELLNETVRWLVASGGGEGTHGLGHVTGKTSSQHQYFVSLADDPVMEAWESDERPAGINWLTQIMMAVMPFLKSKPSRLDVPAGEPGLADWSLRFSQSGGFNTNTNNSTDAEEACHHVVSAVQSRIACA